MRLENNEETTNIMRDSANEKIQMVKQNMQAKKDASASTYYISNIETGTETEIVDFNAVNVPENAYIDTASNKSIYSETMQQYINAETQYNNLDSKKKELQKELNVLNHKVNENNVSVNEFVGEDGEYEDNVWGVIDKLQDYTAYGMAKAYEGINNLVNTIFSGLLFNADGTLMSYEDYLASQKEAEMRLYGTESQMQEIKQRHKDYYAKLDAYVKKTTGMSYEEFEAKRTALENDIETIDSYKYPLEQMVKEKPYIEISETDDFQNYKSSINDLNTKINELNPSNSFFDNKRYINDDDKVMYLYLLETKGTEEADKYLNAIQDKINKSKGFYDAWELIDSITTTELFDENGNLKYEEIYEFDSEGNIITDENGMAKIKIKIMENNPDRVKDDFKVASEGFSDGVNIFANGIKNTIITEGMMSDEQYKQTYIMTFLAEADNSGIDTGNLGHVYNISNSIGNMAIPIMTSIAISAFAPEAAPTLIETSGISAASFASTGLMGLSVFGNSKNDALVEGHDLTSSTIYALGSAISETSLQLLLGNIPGLNDSAKFAAKEILSEGFEEFTQTWVDAGMRAVIFGEKPNFESLTEEALQAFIYGVITSGTLTGGQTAITFTVGGINYAFSNLQDFMNFAQTKGTTTAGEEETRNSRKSYEKPEIKTIKQSDLVNLMEIDISKKAFENRYPDIVSKYGTVDNIPQEEILKLVQLENQLDNEKIKSEAESIVGEKLSEPEIIELIYRNGYRESIIDWLNLYTNCKDIDIESTADKILELFAATNICKIRANKLAVSGNFEKAFEMFEPLEAMALIISPESALIQSLEEYENLETIKMVLFNMRDYFVGKGLSIEMANKKITDAFQCAKTLNIRGITERDKGFLQAYKGSNIDEEFLKMMYPDVSEQERADIQLDIHYANVNRFLRFINSPTSVSIKDIRNYAGVENIIEMIKSIIKSSCEYAKEQGPIKCDYRENFLFRYENINNIPSYENHELSAFTSTSLDYVHAELFKQADKIPLCYKNNGLCPYVEIDKIITTGEHRNEKEVLLPPFIQVALTDDTYTTRWEKVEARVVNLVNSFENTGVLNRVQLNDDYKDAVTKINALLQNGQKTGEISQELNGLMSIIHNYLRTYAISMYKKCSDEYELEQMIKEEFATNKTQ